MMESVLYFISSPIDKIAKDYFQRHRDLLDSLPGRFYLKMVKYLNGRRWVVLDERNNPITYLSVSMVETLRKTNLLHIC